jgi:hypothetical protein
MPLPGWQQAIRREVRQLVHAAGSPVTETIKRTNRPCFVLECCIPLRPGASSRAPRGSSPAALPARRPHGGHPVRRSSHAPALISLLRQIVADDRAGGWRELKRQMDPR